MAASSISDCYLCGARNDPEATYCVRCSGQLLKLPAADADPEYVSIDDIVDDIAGEEPVDTAEPAKVRVRARKGTLQDQRLSDALGLQDEDPEVDAEDDSVDPRLVDTVVTSIPRATPSASIPLLGTRAGVIPQSAMSSKEFGRRTYVLLGLLLLSTAWLGYKTLSDRGVDAPDSIAFTGTSVPPSSTTTTERPRRDWQINEVDGRFGSAFVRVELIACPSVAGEEPKTADSVGVAVTTNNVVFDGSPLPSANIAWIRSRTGSRRLALVERTVEGLYVATSMTSTSRNLGTGVLGGEPAFFVGYDPSTNVVTTEIEPHEAIAQILVTATGDPHSLQLGSRTIQATTLRSIDTRIERDLEAVLAENPTTCQTATALREVVPEIAEPVEAAQTSVETESTEQAE